MVVMTIIVTTMEKGIVMRGYYDEISFDVNTTAKKMHLFFAAFNCEL